MDLETDDAYTCPSFSSYSSNKSLAEIAVRVVAGSSNDAVREDDCEEEEFQFALVRAADDDGVSAEEFVRGGRNGVVFPVFDRDLLLNTDDRSESSTAKLLIGDDELENIPAGTYCVWRPKEADRPPPSKSKSTGSVSKRWKICDLLRSNSEGNKGNFVFLTPKKHEDRSQVGKGKGAAVSAAPGLRSAHEELYVLNRAIKEGNKKKSYLPYKRDLVGIFVNVNGMGKSFPHF